MDDDGQAGQIALRPDETELSGRWIVNGAAVRGDATEQRIEALVSTMLQPVARDASGWDLLYLDPTDGRYWELTLPDGGMHGGGPRRLVRLDKAEAAAKYAIG